MLYNTKKKSDLSGYIHKFFQEYNSDLKALLDRLYIDESLYFKSKNNYKLLNYYIALNIATLIYIDSLYTGKTLATYKTELELDLVHKKLMCQGVNFYNILNLFNFVADSTELEVSGADIEGTFVVEELIIPATQVAINILIENFTTIYKIVDNECN